MKMDQQKYFSDKLLLWHETINNRQLPWKGEKDVYRIWLSEIILQQTRAEQGMKYYERFLKQYPNIQKLAKAPIEEVYKLWEGLGYYNRCRNLHATAQKIVFEFDGKFPDTFEAILELKGIGPYTAAAISSFAFDLPYAVVDGNVFRVLSRFFGIKTPIDSTKGKQFFQQLAQQCLGNKRPSAYNQAIMDFGASVCKPDLPECTSCIMKSKCVAFKSNLIAELPVKEKQTKQRNRWFVFYIIKQGKKFAVQKRTEKDVWANLYQFPNAEFKTEMEWLQAAKKGNKNRAWANALEIENKSLLAKAFKQQLSHQTIFAKAVLINVKTANEKEHQWEWKTNSQLKKLPFPKILNEMLKEQQAELFMLNDATVKQKT